MNDPYQEAKLIASLLDEAGWHEYAEQLRNALVEGGVGTEICMILRWRLEGIANDDAVAVDIRNRVRYLHDFINRLLA